MVNIKVDLENLKIYCHLEHHVDWSLKKEEFQLHGLGFVLCKAQQYEATDGVGGNTLLYLLEALRNEILSL